MLIVLLTCFLVTIGGSIVLAQTNSVLKEPLFTKGTSNTIVITGYASSSVANYVKYGKNFPLTDSTDVLADTIRTISPLDPNWGYYYQVIFVDLLDNPIDTSEVLFSYQDNRPPQLIKAQMDTLLSVCRVNYLDTIDSLRLNLSDPQWFFRYDTTTAKIDTSETGSGIWNLNVSRVETNNDTISLIDSTFIPPPLEVLIDIPDPIPNEGWFDLLITPKDSANHPHQREANPGNNTTYKLIVVYDKTNPSIFAALEDDSLSYVENFKLDIDAYDTLNSGARHSGVKRIIVDVATDSLFTNIDTILRDYSLPDSITVCDSDTLIYWPKYVNILVDDPVADLFDKRFGKYYWRVRVYDASGNDSKQDGVFEYIEPEPPELRGITIFDRNSDDSSNTNSNFIRVEWDYEGEPTHYKFELKQEDLENSPWMIFDESPTFENITVEGCTTFSIWGIMRDSLTDTISNQKESNSIKLDMENPEIVYFTLSDKTYPDNLTAAPFELIPPPGWTNEDIIKAMVSAVDTCSGLQNIFLSADIISPDSLPYQSEPFDLKINGEDTNEIKCWVDDKAENISNDITSQIFYFKQTIVGNFIETGPIPTSDDTVYLEIFIPPETKYLWKGLTSQTIDYSNAIITMLNPNSESIVSLPFEVDYTGWKYAILADSAGNCSDTISIYIEKHDKPEIDITLYDLSEFNLDDLEHSDSNFTDELKVAGLSILKKGTWNFFRTAPAPIENLYNEPYIKIDDPSSKIYSSDIFLDSTANTFNPTVIYAQAKNNAGIESDPVQGSIIYDVIPPFFEEPSFTGPSIINGKEWQFTYTGSDSGLGEVAGIIVTEVFRGVSKPKYFPMNTELTFNLTDTVGLREIYAFLVDKSEIDQNSLEINESNIDHPSDTVFIEVRYNLKELSNYPNPFNPHEGPTNLLFYLENKSEVDISIMDPFGNLVKSWKAIGNEGMNDGYFQEKLRWDGMNDKDIIVANGGYICVIKSDSGEQFIRRIAVVKITGLNNRE